VAKATKWCPTNPKWGASLLETIGPVGKLAQLLECETIREELKRRGHDLKEEFGIEERSPSTEEELERGLAK